MVVAGLWSVFDIGFCRGVLGAAAPQQEGRGGGATQKMAKGTTALRPNAGGVSGLDLPTPIPYDRG